MSISERDRHDLHSSLSSILGPAPADTLMALLPPVGWADVATKQDLAVLETRLRSDMKTMELSLRTDISDLRSEMAKGFQAQTWRLVTVMSGMLGGMAALMSTVVAVFH